MVLSLVTPWRRRLWKRWIGKLPKVRDAFVMLHLRAILTISPLPGDVLAPADRNAPHCTQLNIRRRFQFSSALKRMSTVSTFAGGKTLAAVKGAPETIKGMLKEVPEWYDETYKWYTRRGSRVLALACKEMEVMSSDKVTLALVLGLTMDYIIDQQATKRVSGK